MRSLTLLAVLLLMAGCVSQHAEITYSVNGSADSANVATAIGDDTLAYWRYHDLPWTEDGASIAQSHYFWRSGKTYVIRIKAQVPSHDWVAVSISINGRLQAADSASGMAEAVTFWP